MKILGRIGLALAGCAVWLIFSTVSWGQETGGEKSSEQLLPNSTRAWISVPNPKTLNEAFATTQLGQLSHDEKLKPFMDDLRDQIRARFNDDRVRHGIKLSKFESLDTGEICLAGILPRDAAGDVQRNKHGLIMLINVTRCKPEAQKLLDEAAADLRKDNVASAVEKFGEVEATKWTFPLREGVLNERVAFHAIAGGWLISSNNRELFGHVITQATDAKAPADGTLAKDEVFIEVLKRSKIDSDDIPTHVRWFVDPFGYLDLARVIAEEDQDPDTKQRSTNFAKIVSSSGFDAIKGVSGQLALATGQQEMIHRTFVFAPADQDAGDKKYPKSAAILDFYNRDKIVFEPEAWVPETASSYVTFTWNLDKVVNNIFHVVDAVTDEGSFERMVQNIKESNNVDVRKLVECLNNRISIVSEVVKPIDINSEKIVVGVGIRKDEEDVRQQVKNFFGSALKIDVVEDIEIYSEAITEEEDDGDIFGDEAEEEADAGGSGDVMEQKFVAVKQGYVLISNDLEYLKRIVTAKPQSLQKSADFIRIREMLDKFATPDEVSLRHFARLDRVFEVNYELIRSDKIQSANTILAKILTAAREEAEKEGVEAKKFDPSKMPDYDATVAPYLGPTGWVMESKDDGWLITSCLLKRESAVAELADDSDEPPKKNE